MELCVYVFYIVTLLQLHTAKRIFTNEFAVHLTDDEAASLVAKKYGFVNKGQIGSLKGYYLFEHNSIQKRSLESSHEHYSLLHTDPDVLWLEQQHLKIRVKREAFESQSLNAEYPDPLYPDQWFLHGGGQGGFDMNVLPAWKDGYTGKGIVVSILDDGIQINHPDLAQNYDSLASLDINGEDNDPTPQDNGDNKHGTRCAGEVAAVAFNEFCGVGVAYNASIGGVRMLDGSVTDATEATALSHNPNHIHIYSASWGPEDDGQTVDGPGPLAKLAFSNGIKKGRSGLGSIFVWASGNGGRYSDSCNCDGYTNSIYTLSISSATQGGTKPWYLEQCSSTLATTYSSGVAERDKSITTVDMDLSYFKALEMNKVPNSLGLCTKTHTGTSASAPIAAGICALALEANTNLTWRDMQHLVVLTSRPEPLKREDGWVKNGVGRLVSSKFGYGLMDAGSMVKLARQWKTVEPQHICETLPDSGEKMIPAVHESYLKVSMNTTGCKNTANAVLYLEHVQVKVTLYFHPRGNLKLMLVSPSGTPSTVLLPRPHDIQEGSFNNWPFMSVHFWGEKVEGYWNLFIINEGGNQVSQPGKLIQWSLIFYGTVTNPASIKQVKRTEHGSDEFGNIYSAETDKTLENLSGKIECSQIKKFLAVASEYNSCVDKCRDGQYGDTRNYVCRLCDKSCSSCFGPSYDNCFSCPKRYFLYKNFCRKSCPDGFYADSERQECLLCAPACSSCQHKRSSCLSCQYHTVMFNKTCVSSCPANTFAQESVCKPCHSSCDSCFGLSENECLKCHAGYLLHGGSCVKKCPDAFYEDNNHVCRRCMPTCDICDNSTCFKCIDGWKNKSGICIQSDSCGSGLYIQVGQTCGKCPEHCSKCKGSTNTDCLLCAEGYYWHEGKCINECPFGFYQHSQSCFACQRQCRECTKNKIGDNVCLQCEGNLHLFNGMCQTTCPQGYYSDHGHCNSCHNSCIDCKGGTSNDCISCPSSHYLLNSTCIANCIDGYFPEVEYMECAPCYHVCKTCTGFGPKQCTSCYENASFVHGMCIPCLDNEYYDQHSQICERCHDRCGRCSGPTEFNCLSCEAPLRLNEFSRSCLPCCNQKPLMNDSCCSCSKDLDVCVNSAEHQHITGDSNFYDDNYEISMPMNNIVPIVVAVCVSAAILCIILFGALQAYSKGLFRMRHIGPEYKRVPNSVTARFDAELETASLTQDYLEEDDEIYEKA